MHHRVNETILPIFYHDSDVAVKALLLGYVSSVWKDEFVSDCGPFGFFFLNYLP